MAISRRHASCWKQCAATRQHSDDLVQDSYVSHTRGLSVVRTQMNFPATGEVLAPYAIGHFAAGGMRGSRQVPLVPVMLNSGTSHFDGPPLVSCAAFAIHGGKFTEALDTFSHPF